MVSVAPLEQHNCPLMSRALIDDQQFQIQNLIALKTLHQEDFTILDNLVNR